MISVELSDEDLKLAELHGKHAEGQGLIGIKVSGANSLNMKGKIAVKKYLELDADLNIQGGSTAPRQMAKLGPYYVRTRSRHSYDLIVDPRDLDEDLIILTTCEDGKTVHIHGMISALEGRRIGHERYFPSTRATVTLVPKEDLKELTTPIPGQNKGEKQC